MENDKDKNKINGVAQRDEKGYFIKGNTVNLGRRDMQQPTSTKKFKHSLNKYLDKITEEEIADWMSHVPDAHKLLVYKELLEVANRQQANEDKRLLEVMKLELQKNPNIDNNQIIEVSYIDTEEE